MRRFNTSDCIPRSVKVVAVSKKTCCCCSLFVTVVSAAEEDEKGLVVLDEKSLLRPLVRSDVCLFLDCGAWNANRNDPPRQAAVLGLMIVRKQAFRPPVKKPLLPLDRISKPNVILIGLYRIWSLSLSPIGGTAGPVPAGIDVAFVLVLRQSVVQSSLVDEVLFGWCPTRLISWHQWNARLISFAMRRRTLPA
jgi:hypothetical protein